MRCLRWVHVLSRNSLIVGLFSGSCTGISDFLHSQCSRYKQREGQVPSNGNSQSLILASTRDWGTKIAYWEISKRNRDGGDHGAGCELCEECMWFFSMARYTIKIRRDTGTRFGRAYHNMTSQNSQQSQPALHCRCLQCHKQAIINTHCQIFCNRWHQCSDWCYNSSVGSISTGLWWNGLFTLIRLPDEGGRSMDVPVPLWMSTSVHDHSAATYPKSQGPLAKPNVCSLVWQTWSMVSCCAARSLPQGGDQVQCGTSPDTHTGHPCRVPELKNELSKRITAIFPSKQTSRKPQVKLKAKMPITDTKRIARENEIWYHSPMGKSIHHHNSLQVSHKKPGQFFCFEVHDNKFGQRQSINLQTWCQANSVCITQKRAMVQHQTDRIWVS